MVMRSFENGAPTPYKKQTIGIAQGRCSRILVSRSSMVVMLCGTTARPRYPIRYEVESPSITATAAVAPTKKGFSPEAARVTKTM
jgi:hypothetical protein